MTEQPQQPKTRTITLTGRQPVRIVEDEWPEIAHGEWYDWEGEHEFQSNRKWQVHVRVRQHQDGRAIVYGSYNFSTAWQKERDVNARVGYVLEPGEDIPAAIRRVGSDLAERGADQGVRETVDATIAELPPVTL